MAATGVVIVTWHAGAMLHEALGALPQGVPVVVVDNAGEVGLAERIEAVRPDVRLLVPGRNLGFGQACNLGAAALGEVDVLLLNPDASVDGGALALLCAALDADPGLAAVGPAVRGQDGMWERTWGEDPGFRTEWAERRQGRTVAERPR
ncbi:MAG: glycosyltransferase, partial [Candidatus Sericytochromatia bacterium]|nr:glycosyltransferase [Candidatus Sericytochromatia bacterium]